MSGPRRIGIVGATGALGSEVLSVLSDSSIDVADLVAVATDRSLGQDLEFRGAVVPVQAETPALRGLDLLFLCAPAPVALEYVREALRAEVPCVDVSGALATSQEVPLRVAAFGAGDDASGAPLLVAPPGPALPLALVLRPLAEAAGLARVVATTIEGASTGGRRGIESLYEESVALFGQQEPPEPSVFPRPIAFDCLPAIGEPGVNGGTEHEDAVRAGLVRLLAGEGEGPPEIAITSLQVPVFVGFGAALAVDTRRVLDVKAAEDVLARSPWVEAFEGEGDGLTLRAVAGRDEVVVARLRRDPSRPTGLLLWIAADALRLAAANAVALAVSRLTLPH